MASSLQCPSCGKLLTFPVEQAGRVALCPACGMAVQIPGAILPALPALANQPALRPESPAVTQAMQEIPAEIDEVETIPRVGQLQPLGLAIVGVALGILVVAQLFLVGWWIVLPRKTWEAVNRDKIVLLLASADAARQANDIQAAYDTLRELDRLTLGQSIRDPTLRGALKKAQDDEEALNRELQVLQRGPRIPPPSQSQTNPASRQAPDQPPRKPPPRTTVPFVAPIETPPPVARRPLKRPTVRPLPLPPPELGPDGEPLVSDEQIGRAITRGAASLTSQFTQGIFPGADGYPTDGVDALVVYALLQAGQATHDSNLDPHSPFMKAALNQLKAMPVDPRFAVYSRALRANALALADRPEDKAEVEAQTRWLIQAQRQGGYTYNDHIDSQLIRWDNSNSQYGLLGVWAAAETGTQVSSEYWQIVQQHWVSSQYASGGWGYMAESGAERVSMTLAGLASLFVTQDYLDTTGASAAVGRDPFSPSLQRGMNWFLSNGYKSVSFDEGWPGYTLYGLERVGLASGFKFFGPHNWYPEFASQVVRLARQDGSWGSPISTSYALLFLARGRHPLIMNKLEFDGPWANRPRDLSNLARYVGRTLETQLNWQVVPIDHDWTDWTDSSVLYLASHQPPKISPDEEEKIRQFILSGGLLLTQADGDSLTFDTWATAFGTRLFPAYQWVDLAPDHPLFSTVLRVKTKTQVRALSNGSRLLMIHLPHDISRYWQMRAQLDHPDAFALGMNIFAYASGKSDLRNRLVRSAIPEPAGSASATIKVATVRLAGERDPEPQAWPRFARWFRQQTDLGINLAPTTLADLPTCGAPLAQIDGVLAFDPTEEQVDGVKKYVEDGGVLLIDPCGGANEFLKSLRDTLLPRAFPGSDPSPIATGHPLLNSSSDGMVQLSTLDVRDYVRSVTPPLDRQIYMLRAGKGAVIVSPLDLTSGLLGTRTWPLAGFSPETSQHLVSNIILWTWDGALEP